MEKTSSTSSKQDGLSPETTIILDPPDAPMPIRNSAEALIFLGPPADTQPQDKNLTLETRYVRLPSLATLSVVNDFSFPLSQKESISQISQAEQYMGLNSLNAIIHSQDFLIYYDTTSKKYRTLYSDLKRDHLQSSTKLGSPLTGYGPIHTIFGGKADQANIASPASLCMPTSDPHVYLPAHDSIIPNIGMQHILTPPLLGSEIENFRFFQSANPWAVWDLGIEDISTMWDASTLDIEDSSHSDISWS